MRKNKKILSGKRIKYAVVGDGKCESWYIQMLRRNERAISVDLKPEIPQRKRLSDQFDKVLELSQDYDKVFWMIDFDVIASETRSAKKAAKTALHEFKEYYDNIEKINKANGAKNIIIIINNPCLEYWFLLHFVATSKYFDTCDGAMKQMKKCLPDYEKSQSYYTREGNDIYLKLKPALAKAITNAEKSGCFDFDYPRSGISQMHLFFNTEGIKEAIGK